MDRNVRVELGERSYEIFIGKNCMEQLGNCLSRGLANVSQLAMITDARVAQLWGERVIEIMSRAGFSVVPIVVPGGEEHKNLSTLETVFDHMLKAGIDRDGAVVALGGGIVGDMAGLAAATYMRGIDYVQVPTTLLAQVDSSIGGKTGVNLARGKNIVGAFLQPRFVFTDVSVIETLAAREYRTGLAEVIKYGLIGDAELFALLERDKEKIARREGACLVDVIWRCCLIKAQIVARDEREAGERALLNLGHTFGHAFEALTDYRTFTHGEAVGAGMVYAAHLAHRLGLLPVEDLQRAVRLIAVYGLPLHCGGLDANEIMELMYRDKKVRGGLLTLVLPVAVGESRVVTGVDPEEIRKVLSLSPAALSL